jgi:hypothetical protein
MPRPDGTPYTNFHFDWTGDCRDPGQAIAWLQDARSKTFLSEFWAGYPIPSSINLWRTSTTQPPTITGSGALLMMGTTGELTTALRRDQQNGINAVYTAEQGSMRIWFVRRRAGLDRKSVVIIASFPSYWQGQYPAYQPPEKGWMDMWPANWPQRHYIYLQELIDVAGVLSVGSGVDNKW